MGAQVYSMKLQGRLIMVLGGLPRSVLHFRRRTALLAWLLVIVVNSSRSVLGQVTCENLAGRGDLAVRDQYQQTIDYYLKLGAAAQVKGFNPRSFPQPDQNGNVGALD